MTPELFAKAQRHLSRRDAVMKRIIKQVGPCTLATNSDRFAVLARSIIGQQISGKAAASIGARLIESLKPKKLTPRAILAADEEMLRAAGLSTSKRKALRDLAAHVDAKTVRLHDLHEREDEEVIEHLLPVFGIGRWTAEMFLIFSLGRHDILPLADLGLRAGVKKQWELEDMPSKDHVTELAEPWRPYRSIATWYLWRSFGPVPQS